MSAPISSRAWLAALLGLLACLGPVAGWAQETEADALAPIDRVEAQLERITAEIAELEAGATGTEPEPGGPLEQLRAIERSYLRQREVLRGEEELAQREQETEERLASGPEGQLAKPPPYLLAVLDALADARDAQRKRTGTVDSAVEAARSARQSAEEALERAEQTRRRDAEAADKEKDPAEAARLRRTLKESELRSRAANARLELAQLELSSLERKLSLQERDEELLEQTVTWVRANLEIDDEDAAKAEEQLGDREFDAQRGLKEAERELATAERRVLEAERSLEADPGSEVRTAELEARRAEQQMWEHRLEFETAALARVESQRSIEGRRVKALSGEISRGELLGWREELAAKRAEIDRNLRLLDVQREELDDRLSLAGRDVASAVGRAKEWSRRRLQALADMRGLQIRSVTEWTRLDTLAARVESELDELTARPSLSDRLDDVRRTTQEVWQVELFAVDDRPITVGKIATGLLLFGLGFVMARVLSRLLGRLLRRRTTLETGAATAIQGLLFYVLLVLFFLIALRSVNIPLTAFTVLGGALAIGVGFGSQNIVNNFISGLILLAERPIKVGDIIEVDGERGTVEWIGARSTRVRTFDNIHIIVPNSVFLEKNVVNWTLADEDIRTKVDVGVAYGSPTREVQRLLKKAVEEHGRILERPAPTVLFIEFGDNALHFRTYFWIRSRDMLERLTIESDVRYRIDHLCREAGITIAFPQRDVHLDAEQPIPVRVVRDEDASDDA